MVSSKISPLFTRAFLILTPNHSTIIHRFSFFSCQNSPLLILHSYALRMIIKKFTATIVAVSIMFLPKPFMSFLTSRKSAHFVFSSVCHNFILLFNYFLRSDALIASYMPSAMPRYAFRSFWLSFFVPERALRAQVCIALSTLWTPSFPVPSCDFATAKPQRLPFEYDASLLFAILLSSLCVFIFREEFIPYKLQEFLYNKNKCGCKK